MALLQRNPVWICKKLEGSAFLIPKENGLADLTRTYELNSSAEALWSLLATPMTRQEISNRFCSLFPEATTKYSELESCLDQLHALGAVLTRKQE